MRLCVCLKGEAKMIDGITAARVVDAELASRGIPKSWFYSQSGVSSATLSQWRTGKYDPTPDKLAQIEKCLGINFSNYEKSEMDDETAEVLQWIREDFAHRALFESAKGLTKEQAYAAASFIERLKAGET